MVIYYRQINNFTRYFNHKLRRKTLNNLGIKTVTNSSKTIKIIINKNNIIHMKFDAIQMTFPLSIVIKNTSAKHLEKFKKQILWTLKQIIWHHTVLEYGTRPFYMEPRMNLESFAAGAKILNPVGVPLMRAPQAPRNILSPAETGINLIRMAPWGQGVIAWMPNGRPEGLLRTHEYKSNVKKADKKKHNGST